jgi:hypothetical protein
MLLGIYYAFEKTDWKAGLFFGLSVSIKIVPVILPVWLLLRGRWRVAMSTLITIIILIIATLYFRGLEIGFNDYLDFFKTVILPSQTELYRADIFNFSASSALMRSFNNSSTIHNLFNSMNIMNHYADFVIKSFMIFKCGMIILLLLIVILMKSREITYNEFAIPILFILFMSPQTATSHLVWLFPVYLFIIHTSYFVKNIIIEWLPIIVIFGLFVAQPYFISMNVWRLLAYYNFWTISIFALFLNSIFYLKYWCRDRVNI